MAKDSVELQLQLEWQQRLVEERDALVASLRKSMEGLLGERGDLLLKGATLKSVQDALLREKLLAEKHADQLMKEKAELASENARMHVYAKDCAARAEAATKLANELRAVAEARASAEELMLSGASRGSLQRFVAPPGAAISLAYPHSAEVATLEAQLHASRILLSRVLVQASRAGVSIRREALLAPPSQDATDPALSVGRRSSGVDAALEWELLLSVCGSLGLTPRLGAPPTSGGTASERDPTPGSPPSPTAPSSPNTYISSVERAEALNVGAAGGPGSRAEARNNFALGNGGSTGSRGDNPYGAVSGAARAATAGSDAGASPSSVDASPPTDGGASAGAAHPVPGGADPAAAAGAAKHSSGGLGGIFLRPLRGVFSLLVGDLSDVAGAEAQLTPFRGADAEEGGTPMEPAAAPTPSAASAVFDSIERAHRESAALDLAGKASATLLGNGTGSEQLGRHSANGTSTPQAEPSVTTTTHVAAPGGGGAGDPHNMHPLGLGGKKRVSFKDPK